MKYLSISRDSPHLPKPGWVDDGELKEVLDSVDVCGGKLPVESSLFADLLEAPDFVVQAWWVMLLVH